MKTLAQLERELKEALEDMSNDPLYGAINHEANEDQDDSDHDENCDCCYYAYSNGDSPEGDL
jgi:hypothetical protein